MTTTSDARKRHAETQAAEKLCRVLHHLEWRDDDTGRTSPCGGCRQHAEKLASVTGLGLTGCFDPEGYARIYNEGYTTAQRHAHALVQDLPTRIVATEPLVPATGEPLLSEHVIRRADVLAAFPALPRDTDVLDTGSFDVEPVPCAACAEKASNQ